MRIAQLSQITARWTLTAAVISPLLLSGCSSMNNTEKGALAGAGVGGVAGGLIGKAAGNTGAGVAIGAVTGTLVGAAVGDAKDQSERKQAVQQAVAARGGPLTLEQIRDMSQRGLSDAVIIEQIRSTGTVIYLAPEHIAWLKDMHVSDAVIYELQMSSQRTPRRVVVVEQPPPREVIYVQPPPPSGVYVGVGGRFR